MWFVLESPAGGARKGRPAREWWRVSLHRVQPRSKNGAVVLCGSAGGTGTTPVERVEGKKAPKFIDINSGGDEKEYNKCMVGFLSGWRG